MALLDLDCGIAYSRLAQWLDNELGLAAASPGCWSFRTQDATCSVYLKRNPPSSAGPLAIERSQLTAHGDDEAVEQFRHLFTLRFLSAGG